MYVCTLEVSNCYVCLYFGGSELLCMFVLWRFWIVMYVCTLEVSPRKLQNRTLPKPPWKRTPRDRLGTFFALSCRGVHGDGLPSQKLSVLEHQDHTSIHTYLLNKWSIQTFRHLEGRIEMYVKPYLLDKTHAFGAKHTYIHFRNGYFCMTHPTRNHRYLPSKNGKPSTNQKRIVTWPCMYGGMR